MDWTTGILSPAEAKDFTPSLCAQTSSDVQWIPEVLPGSKQRPGRDADHSSLSRAEVKKE
jgi:hypothetical protein